jgi:hypothetical protein
VRWPSAAQRGLAGIGLPFAGIKVFAGIIYPYGRASSGLKTFLNLEMIPADTRIPANGVFENI